ncbi:MAG TPA: hypothetical protein VK823_10730 [Streptosporangiaceae bacterium]|nr:hypothetical protein [Streptosporangiaceae bacterium]
MQPDGVAEVADELYGLRPADFIAARDERARQVKASGRQEAAAAIRKLARPTASAWLVNQVVRAAPDQLSRLGDVASALQDAQRELAGDRMRELSGERRQVVADLVASATDLAAETGPAASATVLGEVRATFEAAIADPRAGAAVRSGHLTRALTYAGLGEVDLTAALAIEPDEVTAGSGSGRAGPAATGRSKVRPEEAGSAAAGTGKETSPSRAAGARRSGTGKAGTDQAGTDRAGKGQATTDQPPAQRGAAAAQREAAAAQREAAALQRAERALADARAAEEEAGAAAARADETVTRLAENRLFLRRRIEGLRAEIRAADAEDAALARDEAKAKRAQDAATRALATARRRTVQAEQRASRD